MFVPNTVSRPPADMAIPYQEQLIFTIATQLPFVLYFGMATRNIIQRGDPKAMFFGIGGCIAGLFEPVVDVLGFCYFPRQGNWVVYEFLGRPIPFFVPATYGWFVGGMGYWFYTVLRDPKTKPEDIYIHWFKGFIVNLILEYPPLYFGIYTYYGHQPLSIGGFPLWFPSVNAAAPMVAGTIINLLEPELNGIKSLTIITTVATSYGIAHAAFGSPMWLALSKDIGLEATYPAVCLTALLLYIGVWVMSLPLKAKPTGKVKLNGYSKKPEWARA